MSIPFHALTPTHWELDASGCLRIYPDPNTDFWQRTHYGFRADNGHFLYTERSGDFTLTARVRPRPLHQYDQAGLMIRISPDCWLKTSVEYEPHGFSLLGAVVTNFGYSDWSTQPFVENQTDIWLRVKRESGDYVVEHSADGEAWTQLRITRLHEDTGTAAVQCGVYACSPRGAGFIAEFFDVTIG